MFAEEIFYLHLLKDQHMHQITNLKKVNSKHF